MPATLQPTLSETEPRATYDFTVTEYADAAYATSVDPVQGAVVEVYDCNNTVIASGTTNASGQVSLTVGQAGINLAQGGEAQEGEAPRVEVHPPPARLDLSHEAYRPAPVTLEIVGAGNEFRGMVNFFLRPQPRDVAVILTVLRGANDAPFPSLPVVVDSNVEADRVVSGITRVTGVTDANGRVELVIVFDERQRATKDYITVRVRTPRGNLVFRKKIPVNYVAVAPTLRLTNYTN